MLVYGGCSFLAALVRLRRACKHVYREGRSLGSTTGQFTLSAVRHIWLQWVWFVRAWNHSDGDCCAYPPVPVGSRGERNSLVLFTSSMANYRRPAFVPPRDQQHTSAVP